MAAVLLREVEPLVVEIHRVAATFLAAIL